MTPTSTAMVAATTGERSSTQADTGRTAPPARAGVATGARPLLPIPLLSARLDGPITSFPVKVTMLLCDAAQVADGKLYILGGGWSMTGPDPVPSAVALKIDVDWHEAETSHHWELFLEDADGRPVLMETADGTQPVEVRGEFTVSQPQGIPEGSPIDVALAVNLGPIPLAPGTRFAWRLTIDGEALPGASLGFTTRPRPGQVVE